MDLSLVMNTLMSADSLNSISKKTGSSKKEVSDVLVQALPLLLAGAQKQEAEEETAESFEAALETHSENDTSDLETFFDGVDMADGAKIIGHLLGKETSKTTKKVSKSSGTSDDNTALILAAAAPLLMSLLGQETKKSKKKSSKKTTNELAGQMLTAVLDNVDVGSLIMGALSVSDDETEKKSAKKSAKKTTTAKKSTAKKTTTAKKKTAAKTTAKKKTATKKKAADKDEGVDIADAANLLMKLLK